MLFSTLRILGCKHASEKQLIDREQIVALSVLPEREVKRSNFFRFFDPFNCLQSVLSEIFWSSGLEFLKIGNHLFENTQKLMDVVLLVNSDFALFMSDCDTRKLV